MVHRGSGASYQPADDVCSWVVGAAIDSIDSVDSGQPHRGERKRRSREEGEGRREKGRRKTEERRTRREGIREHWKKSNCHSRRMDGTRCSTEVEEGVLYGGTEVCMEVCTEVCTMQYNIIQYNTMQYSTIQYNTRSIKRFTPGDSCPHLG